ncbi:MAG: threonine synthase [Gammaproteobacteria bacterium]|nr:MAG: threonine synthase [Gammaproteobacteria bacterium]
MTKPSHYQGLIHRYRDRLPVGPNTPIVSLNEGDTPLIELVNIPKEFGVDARIHVKFEGLNPTCSFKDRGMTMAVSKAAEEGARAIVCASTGNTSAAAAAYAARAGMTAFVLIPEGKIAMGKLAQAIAHGAVVLQIKGNFDDGMRLVKEVAEEAPVAIVNSINPYRLQGQKTAAFEIVEALGRAPDYHCIPVGNAGNISAYWIGFSEAAGQNTACCQHCMIDKPMTDSRPVMVGYQADGAAPFMRGRPVPDPETLATAIRIGNPQSWDLALAAVSESGGWFDEISDEALLATQALLATKEGVFCEPASAVSLCGALADLRSGKLPAGSVITCTLTGHGLKDPHIAIRGKEAVETVDAELSAVREAILSHI